MKKIIQKLIGTKSIPSMKTNSSSSSSIGERVETKGFPGIFYKYFVLDPMSIEKIAFKVPESQKFIPHIGKTKSVQEWKSLGIDLSLQQKFTFKVKRKEINFQFSPVSDDIGEKTAKPITHSTLKKELKEIERELVLQN